MEISKSEIGYEEPPRPETEPKVVQDLGAGMLRMASELAVPDSEVATAVNETSLESGQQINPDVVFGIAGLSQEEFTRVMKSRQEARREVHIWHSKRYAGVVRYHAQVPDDSQELWGGMIRAEHNFDFPVLRAQRLQALEKKKAAAAPLHPDDARRRKLTPQEAMHKINREFQIALAAVDLGLPRKTSPEILVNSLSARLDGYSEDQIRQVYKYLNIEFLLPEQTTEE